MARVVQVTDDLLGTLVDESEAKQVKVTFDGHDETLDLIPATYEALRALIIDHNGDGVRAVFTPQQPVKRTRKELDEIRHAARAAGMDVKDNGRPSHDVLKWWDTVYLPSLAQANATAEDTSTEEGGDNVPAAAPRKSRRS